MTLEQIIKEASFYSLTDCYRVLHDYVEKNEGSPLHLIRLRPVLELGLPAREVHRVFELHHEDHTKIIIEVNLYGFYGQGSPLPTYFTEELIHAQSIDLNKARHFLDLLHQRLYQLVIEIRQSSDAFSTRHQVHKAHQIMLSLSGVTKEETTALSALPHHGVLLQLVNSLRHEKGSIAGIQKVFSTLICAEHISIQSFVKQETRVSNENRVQLGRKKQGLGYDALIGQRITTVQSKIHITIQGITYSNYQHWALKPNNFKLLQQLCRLIMNKPLNVDITFLIKSSERMHKSLSNEASEMVALGKDSWLGQLTRKEYVEAPVRLL